MRTTLFFGAGASLLLAAAGAPAQTGTLRNRRTPPSRVSRRSSSRACAAVSKTPSARGAARKSWSTSSLPRTSENSPRRTSPSRPDRRASDRDAAGPARERARARGALGRGRALGGAAARDVEGRDRPAHRDLQPDAAAAPSVDVARKEFIATASHELRTPIFSLGGFVELLQDEDLDEDTRREFLETMGEQVDAPAEAVGGPARPVAARRGLASSCTPSRSTSSELARSVAGEFHPPLTEHGTDLMLRLPDAGPERALRP